MSIAVYVRKEYFRAVTLPDKSAHILEFHYRPQTVDVFEKGYQIFHMEYLLESKTKAVIMEFYLNGFTLRGKGYGTVCMNEIADQLGKKGVTMITAPMAVRVRVCVLVIEYVPWLEWRNQKNSPPAPRQASQGFTGISPTRISQITWPWVVPICWPWVTKSPSSTSRRPSR